MLSNLLIEKTVRAALEEDLGRGFDATSQILIPAGARASAHIVAREDGVLCGLMVALSAFSLTDPDFDMTIHAQDSDSIRAGDAIADIEGPARSLLMAERTALNFLGLMSGIATSTRRYVDAIEGTGCEICDTRKTIPGLRVFQKYAVQCGGGSNHRFGLDDAILIKDNHIEIAGGIEQALEQAGLLAGHTQTIEIEVDTLDQLKAVIEHGGVHTVMLDNMDPATIKKGVEMVKGSDKDSGIRTEASGGITYDNVRDIAETGVDYISTSAITMKAPALDFALDIENK